MRNICMTETIYGQSIAGQINNEEEEWQSVARRGESMTKKSNIDRGVFLQILSRINIANS